jgi:hypothetical protein
MTGRFAGMTVNERLFEAKMLDQWDAAARRRDREMMISILTNVEVPEPELTVDAILSNPKKFGF